MRGTKVCGSKNVQKLCIIVHILFVYILSFSIIWGLNNKSRFRKKFDPLNFTFCLFVFCEIWIFAIFRCNSFIKWNKNKMVNKPIVRRIKNDCTTFEKLLRGRAPAMLRGNFFLKPWRSRQSRRNVDEK